MFKLYDDFKLQLAQFIFNCIHLNTPIFHNCLKLNYTVHNYNSRSKFLDIDNARNLNNIFIINGRTTHYGLKLIKVSGPKMWNLTPKQIRDSICDLIHSLKIVLGSYEGIIIENNGMKRGEPSILKTGYPTRKKEYYFVVNWT